MHGSIVRWLPLLLAAIATLTTGAYSRTGTAASPARPFGRIDVSTIPFPDGLTLRTATYTPSGKILVSYAEKAGDERAFIRLATMDDNGANFRPFFAQTVPYREKHNGIRFMVFADNRRIFTGDYIIECKSSLDTCEDPELLAVDYPAAVAGGDTVSHRWSEIIVAPDNRHIAWTTLLANYSAIVFLGELKRDGARYVIAGPRIVSTLDAFRPDPAHRDGVLPQPLRGGEVKQFVHGGTAISVAGGVKRDLPDSVVWRLQSGQQEAVTDTPGYTETTIFSPDERLGVVMSARFSERTDLAVLGLVPRPYPSSLNMGLAMPAYTYSVIGTRQVREGSIGPALIDIRASMTQPGYLGVDLMRDPQWVFHSPMSWHPSSRKAMWLERLRGQPAMRMRMVHLPQYRASAPVRARPTPQAIAYANPDMSRVASYARRSENIDVKVYGRRSGHIAFRRSPDGRIEKTYANFSDDGKRVYNGRETMQSNPRGLSTYIADLRLTGAESGRMDLKVTFGPMAGDLPARLVFEKDASGVPLTHGYAQYRGQRLDVGTLLP